MISCNHYDYIEIACLYRLAIELQLNSGQLQLGIAMDTGRNSNGDECLLLEERQEDGDGEKNHTHYIVLDQIKTMRALNANPHFDVINFSQSQEK